MTEDEKIRQTRFRAEIARGVLPADRDRILRKHIAERREEATEPEVRPDPVKRSDSHRHAQAARDLGGIPRFMGTMKAFFRETTR